MMVEFTERLTLLEYAVIEIVGCERWHQGQSLQYVDDNFGE